MSAITLQPQLPPSLSIWEMIALLRHPARKMPRLVEDYPEAFKIPYLGMPALVVQDPKYAKHVLQENYKNYVKGARYGLLKPLLGNGLLLNEGESWKRHRLLAQPAFHRNRMDKVVEITVRSMENMMDRWKTGRSKEVDFTDEMGYLTIEVVSKVLFGADVGDKVDAIRESIARLNRVGSLLARLPITGTGWVQRIRYPRRIQKAFDTLNSTVYGIINERRSTGKHYDDLLGMLMEARYEDTNETMSDEQLRDEIMTLFIAGHETTVIALSWAVYLLTQHKEVQQKLSGHLSETLGANRPDFQNLPQLTYLSNIINEAMRLYPPIFIIGRKALQDDVVGHLKIPANHSVGINIFGMHRHPKYWKDPERFLPERFNDFELKGDNRFLFLPFGGGPRTCIGNHFAMMEMKIVLAMLVKNFDFSLANTQPILPSPQMTLRPSENIRIRVGQLIAYS